MKIKISNSTYGKIQTPEYGYTDGVECLCFYVDLKNKLDKICASISCYNAEIKTTIPGLIVERTNEQDTAMYFYEYPGWRVHCWSQSKDIVSVCLVKTQDEI